MSSRDTYEKENIGSNTRLLKLYLAAVVFFVGLLTVYQSMTGSNGPPVVGVVVAGVGAISIRWLLRAATEANRPTDVALVPRTHFTLTVLHVSRKHAVW